MANDSDIEDTLPPSGHRLKFVADRHGAFLFGRPGGQRADSRKENFRGANLEGANLNHCNLFDKGLLRFQE
jgi:uncharacterized protein YjbI with pentapeptide repeats